jgi:hypothetical protein
VLTVSFVGIKGDVLAQWKVNETELKSTK